jgi:hypothetical protein
MRTFLSILLLLAVGPALAGDMIARQGDNWVRFSQSPCASEPVRARLLPSEVDNWRAATARFQGEDFAACWREVRGMAYLMYEDGDEGRVPMVDVKEDLGA